MEHEIRITLDGNEIELKPNHLAAKKLSEKYGGLLLVFDHLNSGSLSAVTDVLFWALSKKDSEREALEKQAYAAGVSYLAPNLVRYVIALANGGRIPPPKAPAVPAGTNDSSR